MTSLETALLLHQLASPLTIAPVNKKGPTGAGWSTTRYTEEDIRRRYGCHPTPNVGLVLGPLSEIDIDRDSPEAEADLQELFRGEFPAPLTWRTRRGLHRLFRWDESTST
jgi:hypothetical protein